ncbi:alkyl hydroperoxide reductase subunit AhpC [Bacillus sp. SLBN-46]|nr:alkyl hydroperoxide reductase subunit AhpC [Bacillus sp. SLBN-46]
MAAVAAIYDQLKLLNTEVLAISTDSVYAHKVFTEVSPSASKVNFPLVSDRTHEISKAYRVLNEQTGATFRATVIIDPEGTIVTKMVYPLEVGRNVYEILRVIQGVQYARRTQEGVPANWVPGQPGIVRDPKYIGRI